MPASPDQSPAPCTELAVRSPRPWRDNFPYGTVQYTIALGATFLAFIFPMPFLPDPLSPGSRSVTQIAITLLFAPLSGHTWPVNDPGGVSAYFYVSLTLTFILTHPILIWNAFDSAAPRTVPNRRRRLSLTVLAGVIGCLAGIAIWYIVLFPVFVRIDENSFMDFNSERSPLIFFQSFATVLMSLSTFMATAGLACEIPALMVGMIWLRITSRERLVAWRPYIVLAAFIVGALVTPTPDVINQAIVAVPMCLLYELGLLLARLVPADATQAT